MKTPMKLIRSSSTPPVPETHPTTPPTFTDDELRCIAWAFGTIAWIPGEWKSSIDTVAKKLRAYLGDDVISGEKP